MKGRDISTISHEKLLNLYRTMFLMRRFEEEIVNQYRRGTVPGSAHVYIGQEAIAAGLGAHLVPGDYLVSTHRGHAHSIMMGVPIRGLAAEILARRTGVCRGKGGSMRLTCMEKGVVYSSPIVGSNIPLAVGAALSIKMRGAKNVAVAPFGEGATNIGDFHEGLNLASLWELPVVFVCENNKYALSVSQEKSTKIEDLSTRASSYKMPGVTVDGNDVTAVYFAAQEAVQRARGGGGPTLIECKTYRWLGHHAGEPGTSYRTVKELEEWRKKCPISRMRELLTKRGLATSDELKGLESGVEAEVEDAMRFALESPYPSEEDLLSDVY